MYETIFAPVTANGISAISVFRFSGNGSKNILKSLIKNNKIPLARKLVLKKIYNPTTNELLDVCLVCWMPKPNSFTGEDCFEVQCHGGSATIQAFIDACSRIQGLRFADAGEFSKRAIINGKIDLVQAEAINEIILAETEKQRKLNLQQLNKGLSIPINLWRNSIIKNLSKIEAAIDFSDEDGVPEKIDISTEIKKISKDIKKVVEKGNKYELIITGTKIVLTGPPNSGKSSLFNHIIKKQKSIVTKTPGTTRDIIEKKINLRGAPVIFLDTAGIRNARNLIEKEGIKKAKKAIKDADIVLKILDISKLKTINETETCKKNNWIVLNKIDKSKEERNSKHQQNENTFFVSAKTGKGVKELLNKIHQHILNEINDQERGEYFFTNERQKRDLKKALINLQAAIREKDEEIVAEYLRAASGNLERILGKIDIEEVLGQIFSSFCIGK